MGGKKEVDRHWRQRASVLICREDTAHERKISDNSNETRDSEHSRQEPVRSGGGGKRTGEKKYE